MHYHFSKLYTVYKRDIIQLIVWSRVRCTTTVQNYTLSTSATLYRWLFGAVLVALPLFKTIHCLQAQLYNVVVWSRVSCTTTDQKYTLSTSATLYRWLFGAVLFALPRLKTVHSLQARHSIYRWLFGAVLVALLLFNTI